MQFKLPERLPPWALIVLAVLSVAALSVTFSLVDVDGDGEPDRIDITVQTEKVVTPANVQAGDGLPTSTVVAPAALVDRAADTVERDLRTLPDEIPAERKREMREQISDAAEENRAATDPLPLGGAVQGFRGCVTKILPVHWSSGRGGVRPNVIVDHYTVSYNRPGWSDIWGVWTHFTRVKASSNFIIDAEGNCVYAVPIESTAWTQAGGNRFAVSFEVIAYGNERDYLEPAGWAKLRSVQRQVAARTGIPLRRGAISGCVPVRSGIVEHREGGLCWGGHVDIDPFSIDHAVQMVVKPSSRLTKRERVIAARRCELRRRVVAAPTASAARHARVVQSRAARAVVRGQMRRLTKAKRSSGRPWSYRHRGVRRHELAGVYAGKGCAGR